MNTVDTDTSLERGIEGATDGAIALRLTGFERPLALTLDALRRYPTVTSDPFDLKCYTTQRFIRSVDAYRGVLLTDLIADAGLRSEADGDFKRTVFLAIGHDGYIVTFSWHELFNTAVGSQALVAFECGDRALSAEEGAPVLLSGADLVPAPRHVKRLAEIQARILA